MKTQKGKWYRCEIVIANRFYLSSKTCFNCEEIKEDLEDDRYDPSISVDFLEWFFRKKQ